MKAKCNWWRWGMVLFLAPFCCQQVLATEGPAVSIIGQSTRSGDEQYCFLSLANTSSSDPLANIWITVFNDGMERFRIGPVDLSMRQTIILKTIVEPTTLCDGARVSYLVSFQRGGIRNETLLRPNTSNSSPNPMVGTVLGGLIGFISAIAGILITHRLTVARERRNSQRDRFRLAEPIFNSFFVAWNRSILPQELQTRFNELQSQTTLDQDIVDQYRQTMRVLADTQLPLVYKEKETAKFEGQMREHLKRHNPDFG